MAMVGAMAGLLAASALAEGGGAPLPPPAPPCATDNDCLGCLRCANGFCETAEWAGPTCMCDDECVSVGARACNLSATKPLCGGQCSNAAGVRALVCGGGDDVVRTEPFAGGPGDQPAAAMVSGEVIVVQLGSRP